MGFVQCPECNAQISDTLTVCSNCGFPLGTEKATSAKENLTMPVSVLHPAKQSHPPKIKKQTFLKTSDILIKIIAVLMLVAGIADIWFCIKNIIFCINRISRGGVLPAYAIIYFLYAMAAACASMGFLSTVAILFSNKRTDLLRLTPYFVCGSFALKVLGNIIRLFSGWGNAGLFAIPKSIGLLIVWIIIVITARSNKREQTKAQEIVLTIVIAVLCILDFFETINWGGTLFSLLGGVLDYVALAVVVWLWPYYMQTTTTPVIHTKTEVKQMEYNNVVYTNRQTNEASPEVDGYVKIWKLIVFSLLTFGIYPCIWVYRTVGLFNRKGVGEEKSQTTHLVLWLFVPFYSIYWLYKYSKLTEEYTLKVGNRSNDLAVLSLILSIFGLQLVALALIQDQINKNLSRECEVGNTAAPHPTGTQSPTAASAESSADGRMSNDDIDYLMKLKQLLDAGILTEEEYNAKKEQVLKNSKK